jgi:hypothetical protein
MKMTYSDLVKKYVTGGAAIIYLNKKYGEPKYITPKNNEEPKDITKKNNGKTEKGEHKK